MIRNGRFLRENNKSSRANVQDLRRESIRQKINGKNIDLFLIVKILILHSFAIIYSFRSVCVATALRVEKLRNRASIPGKGKLFYSSS
jgi:hypothetical protein